MDFAYDVVPTPWGEFFAGYAVENDGSQSILATAFGDRDALISRLPGPIRLACVLPDSPSLFPGFRTAMESWLAGDEAPLASLALRLWGTEFQRAVWDALRSIPRGCTRSYAEIASILELGRRGARAVGQAVGSNPICLIIPCHRVVSAGGNPGGYAFGLARKLGLLNHERRVLRPNAVSPQNAAAGVFPKIP